MPEPILGLFIHDGLAHAIFPCALTTFDHIALSRRRDRVCVSLRYRSRHHLTARQDKKHLSPSKTILFGTFGIFSALAPRLVGCRKATRIPWIRPKNSARTRKNAHA